jgi:prophage DNA circulation protein
MWFDSDASTLPGLLPGLYRGISFFAPDTTTTAGRRIAEHLFPGTEYAAYDDMGIAPKTVTLYGLIVGDDYIAKGKALDAAFATPGPATLVHPWLGPMTVILEEPGEISFSAAELRVVRFSVTFKRLGFSAGAGVVSSLGGLATAFGALVTAASAIAAAASSRVISATRTKASVRSHRVVTTAVSGLAAPSGSARALPRITAALPSSVSTPVEFDAAVLGLAAIIRTRKPTPAVSPARGAIIETDPTPASLVRIGLDLAAAIAAEIGDAPSAVDAALLTDASAQIVAALAEQAIAVEYDTRAAAISYRTEASAVIGTITDAIETISSDLLGSEVSAVRRALRSLQTAIIVDVNETIGRLPELLVFSPGRAVDAFAVANHLAGSTPSKIETVYSDIVARNRPRHPALLDGARIEVKAP